MSSARLTPIVIWAPRRPRFTALTTL
jgi:hypothetical protein